MAAATLRSPDGAGEALADRRADGVERDLTGEGREAAEQRGVRQGATELLEGELGRRAGEQAVAAELSNELAEPELVEAAARC